MKKIFLIFAIFLSIKNVCIGQANSSKDIRVYNQSELLYVLYLTNGRMVLTENLILSAKNTDSVELISRFEAIKRFGVITKAGVVILKLKRNVKFVVLSQIFNLFNIVYEDRSFPVYINDERVDRPETIIAEQNLITAVAVIPNPSNKKEKIIDIITKEYNTSKLINSVNHPPYNDYYLRNQEIMSVDSFLNGKNK